MWEKPPYNLNAGSTVHIGKVTFHSVLDPSSRYYPLKRIQHTAFLLSEYVVKLLKVRHKIEYAPLCAPRHQKAHDI